MKQPEAVAEALRVARKLRRRRPLVLSTARRFYSREAPAPINAVSIFSGEWATRLPQPLDEATGTAPQFADQALAWGLEQFGDLGNADVLELGPLEAGHTYMLHGAGARSITAVEANQRAFLRCLIVKELFGLDRASFLHGDFLPYLRSTEDRFDLCIASGVLYHLLNPVELLALVASVAPRLYLWTTYHDPTAAAGRTRRRMKGSQQATYNGFSYTLQSYGYGYSLWHPGFCGGLNRTANWLSRDDLLGALHHVGFSDVRTAFEEPWHPNGPTIAIYASR
jgi:hypothetical protein